MTKWIFFFTVLIVTSCKTSNHLPPAEAVGRLGANPYFEVDGNPVSHNDLSKYEPTDIASLTTYYGKDATNRFGERAKDGAVIIETKKFAINKYESLFKSHSADYKKVIEGTHRSEIQYILNDRILTENFEGDLASINSRLLKQIKVIDQKELLDKFQVEGKKVGVVIRASRPKNLYNGKSKF